MPPTTFFEIMQVGHGPTKIIVAHGWMGDRHMYDDFLAAIDRDRYTYAFFDARGYGTRREEEGATSVEAVAADVLTAATRLGWDRFHVLGHSMGGMATQRLMADVPARLKSAVLLASVPASGAKIDDARRVLLEKALRNPEIRRALIDNNTGHRRDKAWLDRVLKISVDGTKPEPMEGYMASWTGAGFRSDVEGSEVPVLLLMGELDPGSPADRGQSTFMSWYPNANAEVLVGVGHYPMLENPYQLADALDRHFGSFSYLT